MRVLIVVVSLIFVTSAVVVPYYPTASLDCSGHPIPCNTACWRTQGYWSTHQPGDNNADAAWVYIPVDSGFCGLTLGEILDLNTGQTMVPPQWRNVGQQYSGAVLNMRAFACNSTGCAAGDAVLAEGYAILSNPVRCTDTTSVYSSTVDALTALNEGRLCGPACSGGRIDPSSAPSASCTSTPSATPSASQTPTPSATASTTPSASQTPTPSATASPTSSASQTPTPSATASTTSSASQTPMPSAMASQTAAPSQMVMPSQTATPSQLASSSPAPSQPPPVCQPNYTWTQGRWTTHPDEAVMAQVEDILFCGTRSYETCLDNNADNLIPNEHWRNVARQWVAVDLNIRRFGCTEPQPLRVGVAYEEIAAVLENPSLCNVNDKQWSTQTRILADYNEGNYCGRGGPCHVDDLRRRGASAEFGTYSSGPAIACVQTIDTLRSEGARDDATLACGMTATAMLAAGPIVGVSEVAAVYINNRDSWPPRPADVFDAYTSVVSALERVSCGDVGVEALADVALLADYLDGDYYDLGGPCVCGDEPCLREQQSMSPQKGKPVHSVSDQLRDQVAKLAKKNAGYLGTAGGFFAFGMGAALLCVCTIGVVILVVKHKFNRRRHMRLVDESEGEERQRL